MLAAGSGSRRVGAPGPRDAGALRSVDASGAPGGRGKGTAAAGGGGARIGEAANVKPAWRSASSRAPPVAAPVAAYPALPLHRNGKPQAQQQKQGARKTALKENGDRRAHELLKEQEPAVVALHLPPSKGTAQRVTRSSVVSSSLKLSPPPGGVSELKALRFTSDAVGELCTGRENVVPPSGSNAATASAQKKNMPPLAAATTIALGGIDLAPVQTPLVDLRLESNEQVTENADPRTLIRWLVSAGVTSPSSPKAFQGSPSPTSSPCSASSFSSASPSFPA